MKKNTPYCHDHCKKLVGILDTIFDAAKYNKGIDKDDHVMTIEEFEEYCKSGYLIDYDGFGYPVRDGKYAKIHIRPSKRDDIPKDATHVVWYNR